jgi:predicted RNase H-like HicB family nuclease
MTIWFPFTATILQEGSFYVAICPEADVICKVDTFEKALEKLKEVVEKFMGEELPQGFRK